MEEPALPLDTTEVAVKPNWSAAATPVADERSFTVPVGLAPSNLMARLRTPSRFASRGQSSSGVPPSLGEGGTPLLDCPRLAKRLGVRSLAIKFEGANPTGTVKDRSSATGVAAALQFGFTATSVVSSGNA